jgi:aryl-alcohol dehydrogenase-like predicted oxidoreductase
MDFMAPNPGDRRRLLPTDLQVSALGLGTSRLGAFWQQRSPRTGVAALRTAFEAGVTFVDTADCYARGISERLVGRAVRDAGEDIAAEDIVVCTKVGLLKTPAATFMARPFGGPTDELPGRREGAPATPQCFEPRYVIRAAHASLRRLGRDRIDLLVMHEPSADAIRRGAFLPALEWLRSAGDIGAYGICCTSVEAAEAALDLPGVACLQVPANLADLTIPEAIAERAAARGVSLVAIAVLGDGSLLTNLPADERRLGLRGLVAGMLADQRFASILVGASSPGHVRELIDAAAAPLDEAELSRLRLLLGRRHLVDPAPQLRHLAAS